MPRTVITVPFLRIIGTTGVTVFIGQAYPCCSVSTATNAGFYLGPIYLPPSMDPSRPSYVHIVIAAGATSANVGVAAVCRLRRTRILRDNTVDNAELTNTIAVPDNWAINDPRRHTFDSGAGETYPGGTFDAEDLVGFELTRQGLNPFDTYLQLLYFGASIFFEYHVRCQQVCCP